MNISNNRYKEYVISAYSDDSVIGRVYYHKPYSFVQNSVGIHGMCLLDDTDDELKMRLIEAVHSAEPGKEIHIVDDIHLNWDLATTEWLSRNNIFFDI